MGRTVDENRPKNAFGILFCQKLSREENFTVAKNRDFFHFQGIKFCGWASSIDFAGIKFRGWQKFVAIFSEF